MAQPDARQPSRIYRGTVDEVFSHRSEIPPDATVELKVFEKRPDKEPSAQNGSDQEKLHKKLAALIAEAENLESEPGKPLRDPLEMEWGAAVEEKYRKMGFKF